jgi:flavodoxin/Fe-S-cluster-containing hydrogenase component 2
MFPMKSLIIYYSQTGNTKKVARAIHKGMSQVVEQCDLASVKEVKPQDLNNYDLIGLGSPVWDGGETPNVRRFIENTPKQQGRHIFSFNTHGVMPEHYFPVVVRKLRGKGFNVIGMKDWFGSVHFQLATSPYYTEGHPDEIDLKEAEEFGRKMVERSKRISAGETDLIPPVPPFLFSPQLWVLTEFYRSGHNPHGRLVYNPDMCNYPKCTLCIDNCLMEYIDFSVTPRKFGSKETECDMWLGCTFCEMICPTGAISCNWNEFLKESGELLSVFDFNPLEEAAKECVASGKLRMLIPIGEVRWERLYFRVHNKHPRFKIPKE